MTVPAPAPSRATSDAWSSNTKLLASALCLFLIGLCLWRFRAFLPPVIWAIVLAYLLNPLVSLLARLPFLNRVAAGILALGALLAAGAYGFLWLGTTSVSQINALLQSLPGMIDTLQDSLARASSEPNRLTALTARPEFQFLNNLTAFFAPAADANAAFSWDVPLLDAEQEPAAEANAPFTWDMGAIANQALALINPLVRRSGTAVTSFARGTVNALGTAVLIIVASLYILIDIPRVGDYMAGMAPIQSVREDMKALWAKFTRIWGTYLRGQINISLLMSVIVSGVLWILGVQNALGLGLVAGAMEFLPIIGPVISYLFAVLTASFQGTTAFGLSTTNYILLVAGVLLAVHQLEGNVLVPRIIGKELRLHPLVVLLSVLMGTSLAGILGAILAAPVVASLKLAGTYAWYRILDQPLDFLYESEAEARAAPAFRQRLRQRFAARTPTAAAPASEAEPVAPEPAAAAPEPETETDRASQTADAANHRP